MWMVSCRSLLCRRDRPIHRPAQLLARLQEAVHATLTNQYFSPSSAPNCRIPCLTQRPQFAATQYGLDISRRTGDDTEDLTRRSLLFQRFLQLVGIAARLNSDHRLIREGFEILICPW